MPVIISLFLAITEKGIYTAFTFMRTHPVIRWGLIGAGGFGSLHLSALRRLQKKHRLQLIAIAEPHTPCRQEVTAELGSEGVRFYSDYLEMLEREPSLDGVTITAPIPFHYEMTQACLARGVYIYLEKPPVPLLSQLEDLIEADTHQRVTVGFQQISSSWMQQLKSWITQGKLGRIQSLRIAACWPRFDTYYHRARWAGKMALDDKPVFDGPATNALAHLLHNVMYLGSDEPESFAAPVDIQGELYRARPIESYDVACLRGTFPSGTVFTAALTHATEKEFPFGLSVTGTKGWARLSRDGKRLETNLGHSDHVEGIDLFVEHSYDHFLDYIHGTRARALTHLQDCRGYLLTTNGMLRSSGQIHDIAPEWIRRYARQGDGGYDVSGLHGAVAQSLDHGQLFSEMGLPWAVETPRISFREPAETAIGADIFERDGHTPLVNATTI